MASSVAGLTLAAAVRRLVHDLKEVQEHPVPNVSALPLEDDLFVWHGNVRSSPEGVLQGATIHFILRFPPNYPQQHPEVRLLQAIPHPNVRPVGIMVQHVATTASSSSVQASLALHKSRPFPRQAGWRLAMWDCLADKNSWSSAYSVLSVLLQLQVFLLDDDLTYDTQLIRPDQAISQAQDLTCPHCPHSGCTPLSIHPPLPTEQQLANAANLRSKLTVTRPFVPARSRATAEALRRHQQPPAPINKAPTCPPHSSSRAPSPCPSGSGDGPGGQVPSATSCSSSSAAAASRCATPNSSSSSPAFAAAAAAAAAGGDDEGWTPVQHKIHKAPDSSSSSSMRGGYSGRGRGRFGSRGGYGGRGGSSGGSSGRGWPPRAGPTGGYSTGGRGVPQPPANRGGHSSSSSSIGGGWGAGRGVGSGRGAAAAAGYTHSVSSSSSSGLYVTSRGGYGGRGGAAGSSSSSSTRGGRGGRGSRDISHNAAATPLQQQQQSITGGSFAVLLSQPATGGSAGSSSSSNQQVVQQQPPPQQQQHVVLGVSVPSVGQPLTKAAKKNAARKNRHQQQQQQSSEPAPAPATTGAANISPQQQQQQPQQPLAQQQQQQQPQQSLAQQQPSGAALQEAWLEVKAKAKAAQPKVNLALLRITPLQRQLQQLMDQPMQQLVQSAKAGTALEAPAAADDDVEGCVDATACAGGSSSSTAAAAWSAAEARKAAAAGPFGRLDRDAMLRVLVLLPAADVAKLGQTCQWLHEAVEDGTTWQLLMAKAFPGHRIKPSNMAEWKAAYQLESAAILDELRCWLTRANMQEDVLGLPVTYTKNPKTGKLDYILAYPDVLSVTAFKMGVRVTPHGEKFEAILPLYFTASHFNRALLHMEPVLKQLAPDRVGPGGSSPAPDAWLVVLATILNTQVVLLSDCGLSVSQRTLSVYCQVHRLLLAVCEHWGLWGTVAAKLDAFLHTPRLRTKANTPSLGLLLPLLAVGSPARHSWARMSDCLLRESLARKVLWMCKKDPALEKNFTSGAGADPDLLKGTWNGGTVSSRLIAFHVAFLQVVACPHGATLESVMDSADHMYGLPAAALGVRFQRVVKRIHEVSNWQQWFQLLGRLAPSDADMSNLLRWAWKDGASKGYHKAGMDYSRIHAGGVSRILLKGQCYGLPPTAKNVELHVHYKWRPTVHVYYLDGAILLMGPGRELVEAVAWNYQSSVRTRSPGAVIHSGDIMEFENQKGYNWARINFPQLGDGISEIFVTLSAWAAAQLSDIMQPYVQLFEKDTGIEMCQVHLDTMAADIKAAHKCLILARFFKGADGKWTVAAVGSLCDGNTANYGPMVEGCKAV